eukprot:g4147.t1
MLQDVIKNTGLSIRWESLPANTTNLAKATAEPFSVLHLSGHGDGGNFLFEHNGKAHILSGDDIVKFTEQAKKWLKLVVVCACDSKDIGRLIFEMGVPFVVSVQSNQAVMDRACIEMTKVFYHHLFKGGSVRKSFEQGKLACKHHFDLKDADEDEKFILLAHKLSVPDPSIFESLNRGESRQLSPVMEKHNIWNVPTNIYIGRQREMQILYAKLVLSPHRVVVLTGPVGIGKGTLALKTVSYIARRNHFDAAYFVDLSDNVGSTSSRSHRSLWEILILQTAKSLFSPTLRVDDTVTSFFSKCAELFRGKRVLLIFNHLEFHLVRDPKVLDSFIKKLLNASDSHLKILLLSVLERCSLGVAHANMRPLGPLSDLESSEMFLKLLPVHPRADEIWTDFDTVTIQGRKRHVSGMERFAGSNIVKRLRGFPGVVAKIAMLYGSDRNLVRDEQYFLRQIDLLHEEMKRKTSKIERARQRIDQRILKNCASEVTGATMWTSLCSLTISSHERSRTADRDLCLRWTKIAEFLCRHVKASFPTAMTARPFLAADLNAVRDKYFNSVDASPLVSKDDFVRFWDAFWKPWICNTMHHLASLWPRKKNTKTKRDHPVYLLWGFLSRSNVDDLLRGHERGTFLIRMSTSITDGPVISYRDFDRHTQNERVMHIRVHITWRKRTSDTNDVIRAFEMCTSPEGPKLSTPTFAELLRRNENLKFAFPGESKATFLCSLGI